MVAWQETRPYPDVYDVYAQRVTADGRIAPGWPADGFPVCTDSAYQDHRFAISDGAGGAYVAWIDRRHYAVSRTDIYLQRLTPEGTIAPGWQIDGIPVCRAQRDQWRPQVASDGTGGAFVVWEDYRRGTAPSESTQVDLYGQRITPDGKVAAGWPVDGMALSTAPGHKFSPLLLPDGLGGLFLVWTDHRVFPGSDIYALRIDGQGQAANGWVADGVPMCTAPGYQFLQVLSNVVPDGQGGLVVAWLDTRTSPPGDPYLEDDFDIYAQRITGAGSIAPGWPADGVALCTAPNIQQDHAMASDGAGGAIVVWSDYRNYFPNAADLYAQRVLASGAVAWAVDGVALSQAPGFQLSPTMVADRLGGRWWPIRQRKRATTTFTVST